MTRHPADPQESLAVANPVSATLVGFVDHLRLNGFVVGPAETGQVLELMTSSSGTLPDDRRRLKCLLTSRRDEWERFDDLFEAYWLKRGRARDGATARRSAPRRSTKLPSAWRSHLGDEGADSADGTPQIETEGDGTATGHSAGRLRATGQTTRWKTDFRQFVDAEEIAEAEALAYRIARAMRYRLSRRLTHSSKGRRIDLRQTIRRNLGHGGDLIDLTHKIKPEHPVRIVVLLDVSGSMKHYSRFFLQFVKGLVGNWAETDVYLVHTKLVRVTDALGDKDVMRAMARLSLMADGFGGGTRIGDCLEAFNARYAKRTLNSRTVLMVLSDGYDVGPPQKMAVELARLKKRARRLIWLNPLLGWRRYEPVTAAMNAALPHIDFFAAANTPASLAALEPELARI